MMLEDDELIFWLIGLKDALKCFRVPQSVSRSFGNSRDAVPRRQFWVAVREPFHNQYEI